MSPGGGGDGVGLLFRFDRRVGEERLAFEGGEGASGDEVAIQ